MGILLNIRNVNHGPEYNFFFTCAQLWTPVTQVVSFHGSLKKENVWLTQMSCFYFSQMLKCWNIILNSEQNAVHGEQS
jgi:hypothetical protein